MGAECGSKDDREFNEEIKKLRRARKMAFRMQQGSLKVCTIHSFKGWELKRVIVFFRPETKQLEAMVPLLYTAITRSQEELIVYNMEESLNTFGNLAHEKQLVRHSV
jgi:ATP-dependent exoDNAse (exonuclease V) alpha subunit